MKKPLTQLLRTLLFIAAGALTTQAADVFAPGYLKYEYFGGISGTPISGLTADDRYIANNPDVVLWMTALDSRTVLPDDSHESYGARITGFLVPDTTGDYDLFIKSDDASQLYLSTDATTNNLALIAEEAGCCQAFLEPGSPQTTATPVHLIANTKYALQVLLKEGGGGDFVQVAWRNTEDTTAAADLTPIPGKFLGVNLPVAATPTAAITSDPKSTTVLPGTVAVFTVGFASTPAKVPLVGVPVGNMVTNNLTSYATVQWYRDGVLIPGATGASYALVNPQSTDNNVKFSAKVGVFGSTNVIKSADATLAVDSGATAQPSPGFLMYEYYGNIPTAAIQALLDDPRFIASTPDSVLWMNSFDSRSVLPDTSHELYGARITGFIIPTETANYDFFLSSDDASQLYLSTDASTANLALIAEETGCCHGFLEPGAPTTTATPITLQAGQKYAVEALLKEGGGGDFIQVAWRKTTDTTPAASLTPIPGAYLAAYTGPGSALSITVPPHSLTVGENASATFTVGFTSTNVPPAGRIIGTMGNPVSITWYKNGIPVPGVTGTNYTLPLVKPSDNNAKITVKVGIAGGVQTSAEATLTVTTDTIAPTLLSTKIDTSLTNITLVFSEPITAVTATALTNYSLDGGLTITSATQVSPTVIRLGTSPQTQGARYKLTINNLRDTASGGGNVIAAGTQASFRALGIGRGWLTFQYFANIGGTAVAGLTSSPKFPDSPDLTFSINSFSSPNGYAENYGARVFGYFYPPTTGNYRFFLRSDDASQLYFNPAGSAEVNFMTGALPIAEETGCCAAFMEPDTGDAATSADTYHLTAGSPYYIEALLKEGGGGDYVQVAYRLDGDATPAASLQPIPGAYLGTLLDLDVSLQITNAPTDQVGVVASAGVPFTAEDFNTSDGGFTVVTTGDVPGPWAYDDATGTWIAAGGNDACGTPNNSALNSPAYTLTQSGVLTLSLKHRYSFEQDYDGGQVLLSVNGGAFTAVPAASFTQNGYSPVKIIGNGVLLGKSAFSGNSPGDAAGTFVTSVASLGSFKQGDKIVIEFLGAWDECSAALTPSWVVDSLHIDLLPTIVQDFAATNGNFTVVTVGTPPGPWAYDASKGAWIANSGNDACGNANNSSLNSPAYVVPEDDEVTLSFSHRYSFEAPGYDGGQVRISVNGGPYVTVPAESFSANGYAADAIVGTGVLLGQRAFNGDSPGYAATNYITSTAVLGKFKKNDTISVEFVGAWDECSTASLPSWTVRNLTLIFGTAAKASTFTVGATADLHGQSLPVLYQWQRNDGNGFVDIVGETGTSLRFFPTSADLNATFRVVASTPGASVNSGVVKLITGATVTPPDLAISTPGGKVTITFTGSLQSSATVAGPYANVPGAVSPYTPTGASSATFFRSVK